LLANPHLYIFTWLDFYGGCLGAIAGVLVADYWLLRRTELRLGDLYRVDGAYRYSGGWNWRGLVSVIIGMLLAVGGAHSTQGAGPFPGDGLIPFLRPLYSYSWVVGLLSAIVAYYVLSVVFPARARLTRPAATGVGG
jgi:NCS1 family nucleobase:cation symporter-1